MRLELGEHANAGGIYKITCLVNGWFYIGQAKRFCVRARGHSSGTHNKALAADMQKHGSDSFVMEVLAVIADASERTREELRLIRQHFGPGCYNATRRRSPELTPSAIEKIRAANIGKKLSPEHREKLRAAKLGRRHAPETIEKMRSRTFSPETREKMRAARLAYVQRARAARIAGRAVARSGPECSAEAMSEPPPSSSNAATAASTRSSSAPSMPVNCSS